MEKLARYLNPQEAQDWLRELGNDLGASEFAQIRNLDYVFSPGELYPLAPHAEVPLPRITAFAVDMDGTSTTTEPLALHSLEYMVRRFTGRLDKTQWAGLDETLDYPYVIGNSNFRHTEFLIQRYRDHIDHDAFARAFIEAVCWTLACMTDEQRRRDITQNARNCGLGDILHDPDFRRLAESGTIDADNVADRADGVVRKYAPAFTPPHDTERVAAALDIYYMRYHSILRQLERGQGERLAQELLGDSGRHLVEPMPGYDVFIPLVKGWLGPEIDSLYEPLREDLLSHEQLGHTAAELDALRPRLTRLADRFRAAPAKLGLVTASIAYETHACMKEVIRLMAERVLHWPVLSQIRDRLAENLADYRAVFDGFACASDTWEARLKPHRDLYTLALFQMSVPKSEYHHVVGLEDTEPGIIALRAAGVGCAVALPNRDTRRQDYTVATQIVTGGLPELILVHNLLLAE